MADDDEGILLTRITIERRLMNDGSDQVLAQFEGSDSEMPGLVEILGMLAMTNDTAFRVAMGDDED